MENMFLDSWAVSDALPYAELAIWGVLIAVIAIAVIMTVVRGLALAGIMKNARLSPAVLAFIPGAQSFALGWVSDELKENASGKKGINRFVMPGLYVLKWVSFILLVVTALGFVVNFWNLCLAHEEWVPMLSVVELIMAALPMAIISVSLLLVASVAYAVFFYIAHYRIFRNSEPVTAAAMTALSVLGGGIMALVLLFVAKKGFGTTAKSIRLSASVEA